jgi:superoxide dismutase
MTKPNIRTVNTRYDDYYDKSEEEIDNLLAKLDLAKARTTKAATQLADAKEASLSNDSGLFAHLEAAEYRAEADEAVTKETPVKPEGNLLTKIHSHFASMASPFTPQDSPALAKVSMDVTP